MTDVTPDPKPTSTKGNRPRRTIDPYAIVEAKLTYPECAACGIRGANGHHVLPKDKGGDDVIENIVTLCGTGTSRCHGAHHGNPYEVRLPGPPVAPSPTLLFPEGTFVFRDGGTYQRRDADWVNKRIGETLVRDRPEVIDYILGKLGWIAGADFLLRTYQISDLSPRLPE